MPIVPCPSCNAKLRLPDTAVGKQAKCGQCQKVFVVPGPAAAAAPPQPPAPPPAPAPTPVVAAPPPAPEAPPPAPPPAVSAPAAPPAPATPPPSAAPTVPAAPSNEPLVFISHSHEDRGLIEQAIKPHLEQHGLKTWWSHGNIPFGVPWLTNLQEALAASDWFLVVMSPRSETSQWVKQEIQWALAHRPDRIIPVLMEPCEPGRIDPILEKLQHVDFTGNRDAAVRRLVADVIGHLTREARQRRVLEDEKAKLEQQRNELTAKITSALAFDGNWTNLPPRDVPAFVPREQRRAAIIALMNLKGGVGKTTLAANIGAALWGGSPKRRVLHLDLDYQANLTSSCLSREAIERLRQQDRFVHTLFASDTADAQTVIRCVEPIRDDRDRLTEGRIVGSDELLGVHENSAMMRWLLGLSPGDVRFRLRSLLHTSPVSSEYDVILLDCPPRLTTASINALTASDFILVPVLLDAKSTEGAPRLLHWLRERQEFFKGQLLGVGVVANKTQGKTRSQLLNREQEEWEELLKDLEDAWPGGYRVFDTVVPHFNESAMSRKFPASYGEVRSIFATLCDELRSHFGPSAGDEM